MRERAQRTIEIGLGYAISTLFICEGLLIGGNQAIQHVVIDPYHESRFANCGLQFLEEAGVRAVALRLCLRDTGNESMELARADSSLLVPACETEMALSAY